MALRRLLSYRWALAWELGSVTESEVLELAWAAVPGPVRAEEWESEPVLERALVWGLAWEPVLVPKA